MTVDSSKALSDSLGLFRKSYWHRDYTVEDIYRYLVAPIQHDRIRIFYQGDEPVGLITWCWLSKEDAEAFLKNQYYITEDDYLYDDKDELWGIEFIAPYGHASQMMRSIRATYKELYGTRLKEKVNWRRLSKPSERHTKEFKT